MGSAMMRSLTSITLTCQVSCGSLLQCTHRLIRNKLQKARSITGPAAKRTTELVVIILHPPARFRHAMFIVRKTKTGFWQDVRVNQQSQIVTAGKTCRNHNLSLPKDAAVCMTTTALQHWCVALSQHAHLCSDSLDRKYSASNTSKGP